MKDEEEGRGEEREGGGRRGREGREGGGEGGREGRGEEREGGGEGGRRRGREGRREKEADASIHSLLHVSKTSFSCSTITYLLDDFFMLSPKHHLSLSPIVKFASCMHRSELFIVIRLW